MIAVFHRRNYDPNIVFADDQEINSVDYQQVAEVNSYSVEDAWNLTQNNDQDWTKNNQVKFLGGTRDCRSTSIGDVFSVNGKLEVIMPIGYTPFNWGDKISFFASIKKMPTPK